MRSAVFRESAPELLSIPTCSYFRPLGLFYWWGWSSREMQRDKGRERMVKEVRYRKLYPEYTLCLEKSGPQNK